MRKHMFKKRIQDHTPRRFQLRVGTMGLFTLKRIRFELVYMRRFKKIFRRRYLKAPMNFRRRKFWFFITPNTILSGKSTNSRMGAGVGALVRITAHVPGRKSFVEFRHYTPQWLRLTYRLTRYRIPFKFVAFFNRFDKVYTNERALSYLYL